MKRLLATAVMAAGGIAALSTAVLAGPNAGAHIELHILNPLSVDFSSCTNIKTRPDCAILMNEAEIGPGLYYFVYAVVTNGNPEAGIAGMQFGIEYGSGREDQIGIDVYSWTLCATFEFPQPSPPWPGSGGGILLTWDPVNRCQVFERPGMGVVTNAGYFYVGAYSPATMRVTVRPVDGAAKVASCAAEEDVLGPLDLGWATFGMGPGTGHSPACDAPVPTVRTTWSSVKSFYN